MELDGEAVRAVMRRGASRSKKPCNDTWKEIGLPSSFRYSTVRGIRHKESPAMRRGEFTGRLRSSSSNLFDLTQFSQTGRPLACAQRESFQDEGYERGTGRAQSQALARGPDCRGRSRSSGFVRVWLPQSAGPDGRVGTLPEAAAGRARSSQLESHPSMAGCCACHAPSQFVAKWPRRMPPHPTRPIAKLHRGWGPSEVTESTGDARQSSKNGQTASGLSLLPS
jgi:hypothetical protein